MAVSGYNTVTSFFDESGKFKDHKVISFGGVSSYNEDFRPFAEDWGRLLVKNGIRVLSAKSSLNARRPLSRRNPRIGIERRIEDLAPFVACIRKHLLVITGITVDVAAFRKLPTHFYQTYGHDPVFVAFARSLLKVLEFTPDNDKVSFTCDDDEEAAVLFFRLWRKIKKIFPGANAKLIAITFAEDEFLFALQAADLVSGIMRLEAGRKCCGAQYDYVALFEALSQPPQKHEKLWDLQIAFGDKPTLIGLSDSLKEARKKPEADDNTKSG